MINKIKKQCYEYLTDDFFEKRKQDYKIPENYKWIHRSAMYRLGANILFLIVKAYASAYLSICLAIQDRDFTIKS